MDKKALLEQFEEFARWYALPLDKNEDGIYRALETQSAWMSFQHQQAKVEELQKQAEIDSQLIQLLKKANKDLVIERDDLINKYNEYDKLLFQRNKDEQKLYDINEKHVAEKAELQKRVQFLEQELGGWRGKSIAAMINGMCGQCGKEPKSCNHESNGVAMLSNPPVFKCRKCGENYKKQALKGEG